jgi:hypothetical protein
VRAPAWLDRVLAAGATLDLHHPDARAQLAAAILEAIPRADVVAAIAGSARTVLEQKGVIGCSGVMYPPTGDPLAATPVLRELANNAAQTVLFVLAEPLEGEP